MQRYCCTIRHQMGPNTGLGAQLLIWSPMMRQLSLVGMYGTISLGFQPLMTSDIPKSLIHSNPCIKACLQVIAAASSGREGPRVPTFIRPSSGQPSHHVHLCNVSATFFFKPTSSPQRNHHQTWTRPPNYSSRQSINSGAAKIKRPPSSGRRSSLVPDPAPRFTLRWTSFHRSPKATGRRHKPRRSMG